MRRETRSNRRDHRPNVRPVIKAELSEKHLKLRFILSALFLLFGAIGISAAVKGLLTADSGWTTIEINSSAEAKNSDEISLSYDLGSGEASATAEKKELTLVYSEAMEDAFQLFNSDESYADVNNIYYINHHPNEVLEVDETLYRAFELIGRYDNRYVYLGPIYEVYDDLFYSEYEEAASELDPYKQETLRDYFGEIAAYAGNEDAVQVELLKDNRIRLNVSEEYQAFARDNQIDSYVDFFWMKNAFIVDALADALIDAGYTNGSISSFDGFGRCLDQRGNDYSLNIYTKKSNTIYQAGTCSYQGPMSMVTMRDYMITERDILYYFAYEDGETRSSYLSMEDGLCRSSISSLVCYNRDMGCAEILMQMSPLYIADEFSDESVLELQQVGIYSIYCEDFTICYNDPDLELYDLYDKDGVVFQTDQK